MNIEFRNDESEYAILVYCQDSLVDRPIARFDYAGNIILLGTYSSLCYEDIQALYLKSNALRAESLRIEGDEDEFDDLMDSEWECTDDLFDDEDIEF
jgi:hypothetical protein